MINIDDRVLDTLNESEVYLCLQISRYMKSNRMTAWPSIETLAARCKWDERTVKRWRNSLEQKGFLEVKQTPGKSPTYRFKKAGFGVFHAMEDTPAQAENGGARNEGGTFYEGGQNMYLVGVQNMHPHPPQNLYPEVISKEVIKNIEVVREEEREIAPPLPSLKDAFPFSEPKKENAPPVPPPPPNFGPAWPAVSDPYAWPTEASGPCPEQRGGNPADWTWVDDPAPAHVTTYAVPTSETFEAAPGGPTYRAEVHAPAEREVVTPKAKTPKAQPQPRAVEIPETHSAVAPELTRLLCKKHYLQKSAERLAAEMGWLFSKPVAFAIRHIQDSLSSPKGAWAALDFTGCEDAFARWQKDERLRAQGQGGARINSQQGRFGDRAVITAYGNPDSPSYNQPQAF